MFENAVWKLITAEVSQNLSINTDKGGLNGDTLLQGNNCTFITKKKKKKRKQAQG